MFDPIQGFLHRVMLSLLVPLLQAQAMSRGAQQQPRGSLEECSGLHVPARTAAAQPAGTGRGTALLGSPPSHSAGEQM